MGRLLDMVRHCGRREPEPLLPKVPGQRHIHLTVGCSVWPQDLQRAVLRPRLRFPWKPPRRPAQYREQRRGMPGGMPEIQRLRLLDMVRRCGRGDPERMLPKVPGQRHIHLTVGCSVWPQDLLNALGVQPALHFRRGFLLLLLLLSLVVLGREGLQMMDAPRGVCTRAPGYRCQEYAK